MPSLSTSPPPRRYWVGIVFLVVLVELLGWNLYAIKRNQETFGADEIPARHARNIASVAGINSMAFVRTTFAAYHRLRMLEGKTVLLPPSLAGHRFYLERVSRLRIEMAPDTPRLPAEVADRIDKSAEGRCEISAGVPVWIKLDPGATRYVVARRDGDKEIYVIVSEGFYQHEQATAATAPPAADAGPTSTP